MITLAVFIGIWTSTCIQTQVSGHNQGFVKESYTIERSGDFEFRREWFTDEKCTDSDSVDSEAGTLEIGKKITGMFLSGQSHEANFTTVYGMDLGALSLVNGSTLKVARGMKNSTMRNTMLGLFEYKK
ncbi:MAG TPA: hypothetical protein VNJ01_00165 [Bacteriovoracaceae bacterium]|nr:hypothetical protein [Bacteriovoracaceae bacterium]